MNTHLRHAPEPLAATVPVRHSRLAPRTPTLLRLAGCNLTGAPPPPSHTVMSAVAIPPAWRLCLLDAAVSGKPRGLTIHIRTTSRAVRLSMPTEDAYGTWLLALVAATSWRVDAYYALSGADGAASREGVCRDTGEPVTVTVLKRVQANPRVAGMVAREADMARTLPPCPSVVGVLDVFESATSVAIVREAVSGGNLLGVLGRVRRLPEADAKKLMRRVLGALAHLHAHGVVHRDIRAENIVFGAEGVLSSAMVALTSLTVYADGGHPAGVDHCLTDAVGTPHCVAPEIVEREPYGLPVDVWAAGVLAYTVLSGRYPFVGNDAAETLEAIRRGRVSFPGAVWGGVGGDARALIRGMLRSDPGKRVTVAGALAHPWFWEDDAIGDGDGDEGGVGSTILIEG
ncbi:hypothetical protein I4F81_011065 [Pyropia yezoensis]|uniref:Uncharacterized protein n=1 Tax=Pyropia yezoensis TaxID=2788 RepID=A0ACC3CF66_PYRYE|nr:hypothetical protein I4F81_011065 [Neopyropia yezoensis]